MTAYLIAAQYLPHGFPEGFKPYIPEPSDPHVLELNIHTNVSGKVRVTCRCGQILGSVLPQFGPWPVLSLMHEHIEKLPDRWVCDVCMGTVAYRQVAMWADGEHVICCRCIDDQIPAGNGV